MKKDTLYLHVGWSKTGTSAIQAQIQEQKDDFLAKGVLYPQSLQWPDHSHHPFALSFQGSGSYQSNMTPAEALEALRLEMESSPAHDVLISSELSPFYFNNSKFKEFVAQHFERVQVIFTVRSQSELLLSLFNQLVKDPNVRYGASLFSLSMRNIHWLNFYQNVKQWADVVGANNITVIPYGLSVVEDFFEKFSIPVQYKDANGNRTVNPSLPTRCLAVLQARGRKATDAAGFSRIRNEVISLSAKIPTDRDRHVLFSVPEQQALDDYFKQGNQMLANEYGIDVSQFQKAQYKPIKVLPPGVDLEKLSGAKK
ncbi:hypothetical protein [Halomonas caseinilytica]|uniref:hypothetical protein n=1 Tax=Halomonas caseinilytica TaxID=438744 RepID=UPI0008BD2D6D|nr:hypothetical protein [Halomonas caseinilytica]SEN44475.1 hypothetical protein SAMN04487952_11618 [Halomonas caseinilytica]